MGQGPDGPVLLENPLTAKSAEALADSLKALGITGAADQVVRLPGLPETGAGVLVLAGVRQGQRRRSHSPRRRCAAPPVPPSASSPGWPRWRWRSRRRDVADVAAVAEGAALGAYSFTEYRSSKDGLKDPVRNAVIFTDVAGAQGTRTPP